MLYYSSLSIPTHYTQVSQKSQFIYMIGWLFVGRNFVQLVFFVNGLLGPTDDEPLTYQ